MRETLAAMLTLFSKAFSRSYKVDSENTVKLARPVDVLMLSNFVTSNNLYFLSIFIILNLILIVNLYYYLLTFIILYSSNIPYSLQEALVILAACIAFVSLDSCDNENTTCPEDPIGALPKSSS